MIKSPRLISKERKRPCYFVPAQHTVKLFLLLCTYLTWPERLWVRETAFSLHSFTAGSFLKALHRKLPCWRVLRSTVACAEFLLLLFSHSSLSSSPLPLLAPMETARFFSFLRSLLHQFSFFCLRSVYFQNFLRFWKLVPLPLTVAQVSTVATALLWARPNPSASEAKLPYPLLL